MNRRWNTAKKTKEIEKIKENKARKLKIGKRYEKILGKKGCKLKTEGKVGEKEKEEEEIKKERKKKRRVCRG